MQELKRFPTLQSDIAASANDSLERFRDESKKTVQRLVEMEAGYLTVEFFRKINDEANRTGPNAEKDKEKDKRKDKVIENFSDHHLRKIGT